MDNDSGEEPVVQLADIALPQSVTLGLNPIAHTR